MANTYVNKVVQSNGTVLIDISDATATADKILQGYTAYGATGEKLTGTATSGGGGGGGTGIGYVTETPDEAGGTIIDINMEELRNDLTIPKDVDFIDYDGRLLYSYTKSEFLALESLPANPTNTGLVAQGWNWTLADAKAFVTDYGALVVGQNYTTSDGKTRVYLTIPTDYVVNGVFNIRLNVNWPEAGSFTVAWGDGDSQTVTKGNTSYTETDHTYTSPGDYVIEITVASGSSIRLGYYGSNRTLLYTWGRSKLCVTKVEIGDGVIGLCRNTFAAFHNMKSVSIPTTCKNHDTGTDIAMFSGDSLTGIVFPSGTVGQDTRIIANSSLHLKYVSIPKTMTGFRLDLSNTPSLRKLIFPSYTTSAKLDVKLYDCIPLTHFIVPGTYTTIENDRCRNSLIRKLIIPASVTAITQNTPFSYNNDLTEIHILPESPPTLNNKAAFAVNINTGALADGCIMYVPYSEDHSILTAYQTSTNWSSYASYMQEEPQGGE